MINAMDMRSFLSALLLSLGVLLAACAVNPPAAAPVADSADSADPAESTNPVLDLPATPATFAFAPDTHVAGIDIGGMDEDTATAQLTELQSSLMLPLELRVDDASLTLRPADLDLALPIAELLTEARRLNEEGAMARVPMQITYDRQRLRRHLTTFARQTVITPTLHLLTDTETISRSFAYTPGRSIHIERAIQQIEARLRSPLAARRVTLERYSDPTIPPPPVTFDMIQEQVNLMAATWDGVVGFYLYDLASGETVSLNENTVFSGASVMKVAILLQAHIGMKKFNREQHDWANAMIINSDNLLANELLAASIGGKGTEDALTGVLSMTNNLRRLGLEHTYQYMPYEGYDYLVDYRGLEIQFGPPIEGPPPHTEADPLVRTTPAEMVSLFLMIEQCSQGYGPLLDMFGATLFTSDCENILDLLAKNADDTRLVAGLPPGTRVAHKSGWVEDMQTDVGIVRSPGGDFVIATYLYEETDWLKDWIAAPVIAHFTRMVYTAYNPVRL